MLRAIPVLLVLALTPASFAEEPRADLAVSVTVVASCTSSPNQATRTVDLRCTDTPPIVTLSEGATTVVATLTF